MTALLRIESVGVQATVQDLGRPGYAAIGVTAGGAADRTSLQRANRIVGNPPGAAAIEIVLGLFSATVLADTVVSVTGAPCPLRINGRAATTETALHVSTDDRIVLDRPPTGLRSYLALAGGIAGDTLLGSLSSSPSMGLGRTPLGPGDIATGAGAPGEVPVSETFGRWHQGTRLVSAMPGPRADDFADDALDLLFASTWRAGNELDRVGIRLDGPSLAPRSDAAATMASEPVVRGAIQVSPDGRPTVFLADHPVTGGYPVIAVVADADTDELAQLTPGDEVRFRRTTPAWK